MDSTQLRRVGRRHRRRPRILDVVTKTLQAAGADLRFWAQFTSIPRLPSGRCWDLLRAIFPPSRRPAELQLRRILYHLLSLLRHLRHCCVLRERATWRKVSSDTLLFASNGESIGDLPAIAFNHAHNAGCGWRGDCCSLRAARTGLFPTSLLVALGRSLYGFASTGSASNVSFNAQRRCPPTA